MFLASPATTSNPSTAVAIATTGSTVSTSITIHLSTEDVVQSTIQLSTGHPEQTSSTSEDWTPSHYIAQETTHETPQYTTTYNSQAITHHTTQYQTQDLTHHTTQHTTQYTMHNGVTFTSNASTYFTTASSKGK